MNFNVNKVLRVQYIKSTVIIVALNKTKYYWQKGNI